MHLKQYYLRYVYVGAVVVVLLSAGLGVWAWTHVASPLPSSQKAAIRQLMTPTPPARRTPSAGTRRANSLHPTSTHVVHSSPIPIHTDAAAHLIIPSIGVDAPIEMVGLDAGGRMQVPTKNQWNDVGWYSKGTPPGAQGSAVIDGHLDTNTGAPAVFWRLNAIHVGDMLTVRDNAGRKAQFRVFKLQSYDIDQAPLDRIFAKTDGVYLNLITCAGSWDYSQNQFQQRLVVFTQLV